MRAVDLARELGIKDPTPRRRAQGYEEMGGSAFPGNGGPKANKDYGIAKLRKRVGELEREIEPLKYLRAFLSQDHARGASPSKSAGAGSAPSGRRAGSCACPNPNTTATRRGGNPERRSSGRLWGPRRREARSSQGPLRAPPDRPRAQARRHRRQRETGARRHAQAGAAGEGAGRRRKRAKAIEMGGPRASLADRAFDVGARSRLLAGDITCIGTGEG